MIWWPWKVGHCHHNWNTVLPPCYRLFWLGHYLSLRIKQHFPVRLSKVCYRVEKTHRLNMTIAVDVKPHTKQMIRLAEPSNKLMDLTVILKCIIKILAGHLKLDQIDIKKDSHLSWPCNKGVMNYAKKELGVPLKKNSTPTWGHPHTPTTFFLFQPARSANAVLLYEPFFTYYPWGRFKTLSQMRTWYRQYGAYTRVSLKNIPRPYLVDCICIDNKCKIWYHTFTSTV